MSKQKKFHGSLFGYKKSDVNRFLVEFNASYEQMEEYYRDAMRSQANRLVAADSEQKAMLGKMDAQQKELTETAAKLKSLEAENARLQESEKALEAIRENLAQKTEALGVLQDSFDDTVLAAKEGIDDAQSVISAQSERIAALEETLAQTQSEYEQAKAVIAQTKEALAVTKNEIEQIKAESRNMAEIIAATVAPKVERKPGEAEINASARAEQILADARKQAEEIVSKAKQTAQLIKISALRREDTAKPAEKEKASSAQLEPEQIKICLNEMYGEGDRQENP